MSDPHLPMLPGMLSSVRSTGPGDKLWRVLEVSTNLQLQQYKAGRIGMLGRSMKSGLLRTGEAVDEFRIITLEAPFVELAVGSERDMRTCLRELSLAVTRAQGDPLAAELSAQYSLNESVHQFLDERFVSQPGGESETPQQEQLCSPEHKCGALFNHLDAVTLLMILSEETPMRLVRTVSPSCHFLRHAALSNAIWCAHFRNLNHQVGWLPDDELVVQSEAAIDAYYSQPPEHLQGNGSPFGRMSYVLMYRILYERANPAPMDHRVLGLRHTSDEAAPSVLAGVVLGVEEASAFSSKYLPINRVVRDLIGSGCGGAWLGSLLGADILGAPGSVVGGLAGGVIGGAEGVVVTSAKVGVCAAVAAPGSIGLVLNSTAEGFRSSTGTMLGHWKDEDTPARTAVSQHSGGILHGAALGLAQLGDDVKGGLRGLVSNPVRGFQEDGAVGAVKGLVRGAAEAVARPVAGALDTVAGVGTGVSNRVIGLARGELLDTDKDVLERLTGAAAEQNADHDMSVPANISWMWGDTSRFARKNPMRWSGPKRPTEIIQELERHTKHQHRPVLIHSGPFGGGEEKTFPDVSAAIECLRQW